jgi:hypothetical protein
MLQESLRASRKSRSIDKEKRSKLRKSIERTAVKNMNVVKSKLDEVFQKTNPRHQAQYDLQQIMTGSLIEQDQGRKQHAIVTDMLWNNTLLDEG